METERESVFSVLGAEPLKRLHDEALAAWYASAPDAFEPGDDLVSIVRAQHFCNFKLWGLEDEARRRDVDDAYIADVKRGIDQWNQRRNDLIEAIDRTVLDGFADVDTGSAAQHSETAGMMADRLSILALKIWHMGRYAEDEDDPAVAQECRQKQAVLHIQRDDLAGCLDALLRDFGAGRRFFKSYRQFKAYNDPRLNPALKRSKA